MRAAVNKSVRMSPAFSLRKNNELMFWLLESSGSASGLELGWLAHVLLQKIPPRAASTRHSSLGMEKARQGQALCTVENAVGYQGEAPGSPFTMLVVDTQGAFCIGMCMLE